MLDVHSTGGHISPVAHYDHKVLACSDQPLDPIGCLQYMSSVRHSRRRQRLEPETGRRVVDFSRDVDTAKARAAGGIAAFFRGIMKTADFGGARKFKLPRSGRLFWGAYTYPKQGLYPNGDRVIGAAPTLRLGTTGG